MSEDAIDIDLDGEEDNLRYEHFRFQADPGQTPIRIDKFLTDRITNVSRNRIQNSADAGCICVNGKAVKSNYKIKPGEVVTIMLDYPPNDTSIIEPKDIPLDIVYEDDELIVINKQAGLVVHPGHGNFDNTLLNALAYHFNAGKALNADDPRLGLVHRIDKDTSGLLLVAKTPFAKTYLAKQFFDKTTDRLYNAIIWGVPETSGTITGNIGRDPKDRLRMTVFEDASQGKHAVTHYRVLESFNFVSLVECKLETGRTHQIRAHMKYIGHPLFSDARYGGDKILKGNNFAKYTRFVENCFQICPRQALHARTLGFEHPITRKRMMFDSPLPADMEELLSKWRAYTSI